MALEMNLIPNYLLSFLAVLLRESATRRSDVDNDHD